jgi:glycosyltransferase involved in cell wall biosynthesis
VNKFDSVWVVIPAYNESKVIEEVLKIVKDNFGAKLVVVDDCSTDDTSYIANKYCDVVRHPINLGQGAALQTGIDYALKCGAEIIVTFDSDGQHRIEDAIKMINLIKLDVPMVVCGSRFLGIDAENMPFKKLVTLRLATLFTRIVTRVNVTDAHNGLRVMNRKALERIRISQNRMAHATEIIRKVRLENVEYREAPVKILYTNYSVAKGQKISNIINIVLDLIIGGVSK